MKRAARELLLFIAIATTGCVALLGKGFEPVLFFWMFIFFGIWLGPLLWLAYRFLRFAIIP